MAPSDSQIDSIFGDFTASDPAKPSSDDLDSKIMDKREAMELLSFKLSLTYLEKVLIVLKNNVLSEGKCMGHIGVELGGVIDPSDGEGVQLHADFTEVAGIWSNPQVLLKNANPNVKMVENAKSNIHLQQFLDK